MHAAVMQVQTRKLCVGRAAGALGWPHRPHHPLRGANSLPAPHCHTPMPHMSSSFACTRTTSDQ